MRAFSHIYSWIHNDIAPNKAIYLNWINSYFVTGKKRKRIPPFAIAFVLNK